MPPKTLLPTGLRSTANVLLRTIRTRSKDQQERLAALDELSALLLSGKNDSEISAAAVTLGWAEAPSWSNSTDEASRFIHDHLVSTLLPVLGEALMDSDAEISQRTTLVLARIGASLGSEAQDFFAWACAGVNKQATQDPVMLSVLLAVISQTMRLGQQDAVKPFAVEVVKELVNLLETVEHYQMVIPIVVNLQQIARLFPLVVSGVFKDIIDLLVGWSLDPIVPERARQQITTTFANFEEHWSEHLDFAEALLSKLVDDLEALDQVVRTKLPEVQGAQRWTSQEAASALSEISRLAACFVGVLSCSGKKFVKNQGENFVRRFLACIEGMSSMTGRLSSSFLLDDPNLSWRVDCYLGNSQSIVRLLINLVQCESAMADPIYKNLETFIGYCANHNEEAAVTVLLHLVNALGLEQYMRGLKLSSSRAAQIQGSPLLVGTELSSAAMSRIAVLLLNPASVTARLRLKASRHLAVIVRQLYFGIWQCSEPFSSDKSECWNQRSSSSIIGMYLQELEDACRQLRDGNEKLERQMETVSKKEEDALVDKLRESEMVVVFLGGILLQSMKELQGDLDLVVQEQLVSSITVCATSLQGLSSGFHAASRAQSVFIHLLDHLLGRTRETEMARSLIRHSVEVICILYRPDASQSLKLSIVQSLYLICVASADGQAPRGSHLTIRLTPHTLERMCTLAGKLARDPDAMVRLSSARTVCAAALAARERAPLWSLVLVREAMSRLSDKESKVVRAFSSCLGHISHLVLLFPVRLLSQLSNPLIAVQPWQRALACNPAVPMRSADFQRYISFVSQRSHLDLSPLLPRIYAVSEAVSKALGVGEETKDRQQAGSDAFNAFYAFFGATGDELHRCELWALMEASRLLVRSKLRSSFGGPVQTFEALEHMLLEACTRAEMEARRDEVAPGQQPNWHKGIRMLLHLLGHLERQIFNAYEGSVNLPQSSAGSAKFFRGNRKVCEDWFSRLRKAMSRASSIASSPHHVLEQSLKRLPEASKAFAKLSSQANPASREEVKKMRSEIDALTMTVCSALSNVGDADGLEGFAAWIKFSSLKGANLSRDTYGWVHALSLQTRGHYEEAQEMYSECLSSSSSNPETISFIFRNAMACCLEVGDVKAWRSWQARFREMFNSCSSHTDGLYPQLSAIQGSFESQATEAQLELDVGNVSQARTRLMLVPDANGQCSRSLQDSVYASKLLLLRSIVCARNQQAAASLKLLAQANDILVEPLNILRIDGGCEFSQAEEPLVLLSIIAHVRRMVESPNSPGSRDASSSSSSSADVVLPDKFLEVSDAHLFSSAAFKCDPSLHSLPLWHRLLSVLEVMQPQQSPSSFTPSLRLKVAKIARKQRNLTYAENLLSRCDSSQLSDLHRMQTRYEYASLSLARRNASEGLERLWSLWFDLQKLPLLSASSGGGEDALSCVDLSVKTLRKVAMMILDKSFDSEQLDVNRLFRQIFDFGMSDEMQSWASELSFGSWEQNSPHKDFLGGYLLFKCTAMHRKHAKSWADYGSWCYRQGRHYIEAISKGSGADRLVVRERIQEQILSILMADDEGGGEGSMSESILREISSSICDAWLMSGGEEEKLEPDPNVHGHEIRMLCEQLCPWASEECIWKLEDVWRQYRRRILCLYRSSVSSYFEYLRLSEDDLSPSSFTSEVDIAEVSWKESYDITATLRLLRLLVKYGSEMCDIFFEGVQHTPTRPWRKIIPQLFARLGHAEPSVRQNVRLLITKIGKELPHAIIYPTVVGHVENPSSRQLSSILEALRESRPELVRGVQGLIGELSRCSILKEDLFFSSLQELNPKVSSGLRLMREETSRIRDNSTLSDGDRRRILREKYDAITKPVRMALEPLKKVFAGEQSSDHDKNFVSSFSSSFTDALASFRNPADIFEAEAAWEPMRALMRSLTVQLRRTKLSLNSISPYLGQLRATDIPMPGIDAEDEEEDSKRVTIASFDDQVDILLTKTKPKKIAIIGSDGISRRYLLKGREDLHLDERMMQFLSIVNHFMRQDRASHARCLRARHYAVIPVGPRSGLIQWADGTIPLFGIYKAWQTRQMAQAGEKSGSSARPSDMFYDKIIPALKEQGITRVTSRKEWPHEVLKQVFSLLVSETPRDLISREIWCSCLSPSELWSKTNMHARSMAVMSMVGYVIGLGDRHLDNILMDFESGEVVHIDWNVCFEKGSKLKVPELVPFRMTHTLQSGMGFTGVEGPFRVACEKALRVLRRNKEALLTLLEAFVYDPLVDWTAQKHGEEASKGVELHVSLSLFASRVEEMRVPLAENLKVGHGALGALQQAMGEIVRIRTSESAVSVEVEEMENKLRASSEELRRVEADLREAQEKVNACSEVQPKVEAQWERTKQKVQESMNHCAEEFAKQESCISTLRTSQFDAIETSVVTLAEAIDVTFQEYSSLFVMEQQGSQLGGGEQALWRSLETSQEQARAAMRKLAESCGNLLMPLKSYKQRIAHLPAEYAKFSRLFEWWDGLAKALEDPSPGTISMLLARFSDSEERMEQQRSECLQIKAQMEKDLSHAHRSYSEVKSSLALAEDLSMLEHLITSARNALWRSADFASLSLSACSVYLCSTLGQLLTLAPLRSDRLLQREEEFVILSEQWVYGSNRMGDLFQLWQKQTSVLNEGGGAGGGGDLLDRTIFCSQRCLLVLHEMLSITNAATSASKGKKGAPVSGTGGGDQLGLSSGIAGFEACERISMRMKDFVNELNMSVLPDSIGVLLSDPESLALIHSLHSLASQARTLGQALDSVECGEQWGDSNPPSAETVAARKQEIVSRLKRLQVDYERISKFHPADHQPPAAAPATSRPLFAGFDRIFDSLVELFEQRSLPPNDLELEANVLGTFFVGKLEMMHAALSLFIRCPSPPVAFSLVPSLRARIDILAHDLIRKGFAPLLVRAGRLALERSVPPAVLAGQTMDEGDGRRGGGKAGVWAIKSDRSSTQHLPPPRLGQALAKYAEDRRGDARLRDLEQRVRDYCDVAMKLKRSHQVHKEQQKFLQHCEAKMKMLEANLFHLNWVHEDVLYPVDVNHQAGDGGGRGSGAVRRTLVNSLLKNLETCQVAFTIFAQKQTELKRLEDEIVSRGRRSETKERNKKRGKGERDKLTAMIEGRFKERRSHFDAIKSKIESFISLAQGVSNLERSRQHGELAIRVDAANLNVLHAMERARETALAHHHERSMAEAVLQHATRERLALNALIQRLQCAINDSRNANCSFGAKAIEFLRSLPDKISPVKDLLVSEEQLVGEIAALLDTVVKITVSAESLHEIHSIALQLQTEQQVLKQGGADLASLLQLVSSSITEPRLNAHLRKGDGKLAGHERDDVLIDTNVARGIQRLTSEVMTKMAMYRSLLQALAQLALERVQSDQHEDESHDQSAYVPASPDKERGRREMEEEGEGEEQQMQEQRNAHAVSVLKRVRQKLDGRDKQNDGNTKLTVQEQVEMTIKEATNIDKLCEMYEGWTPWV